MHQAMVKEREKEEAKFTDANLPECVGRCLTQ